jgi:hypothetical protein
MPPNFILHPATDAAANQQLHFEFDQPSRARKPGKRSPIFVLDQLIFHSPLQDDQQSFAAVKDRGYPPLMFRDGKSHFVHLHAYLSSSVPQPPIGIYR